MPKVCGETLLEWHLRLTRTLPLLGSDVGSILIVLSPLLYSFPEPAISQVQ